MSVTCPFVGHALSNTLSYRDDNLDVLILLTQKHLQTEITNQDI